MRNLTLIIIMVLELVLIIFFAFSKRKRIPIRITGIIAAVLLVCVTAWVWFNPSWKYPELTGEYKVASVVATYTDETRLETYSQDGSYRWLNVELWYPKDVLMEKSCPLVVFSHGSFGGRESNLSLYLELASHGYVVCAIDHTYQCLDTTDPEGNEVGMDSGYKKQIMTSSDKSPEKREQLYEYMTQWMKVRVDDINFVIDTIIASSDAGSSEAEGVYRLVDTKSIGVMGHSLGGSAALGIGRVRDDVSAVISLEAPFMCDIKGTRDGEFVWNEETYPVPVLNVYSDSIWDRLGVLPQYVANYEMLNDNVDTTYDIHVSGAGHMTLTDLALSTPPLCLFFQQNMFFDTSKGVKALNEQYLEFFDCYLKGDGIFAPTSFE